MHHLKVMPSSPAHSLACGVAVMPEPVGPLTGEAVSLYLNLLVGDLQIRRVIGREPPLGETAINRRAEQAYDRYLRLRSPSVM